MATIEQAAQDNGQGQEYAADAPKYDKGAWTGKPSLREEDVYVEALDTWVRVRELNAGTVSLISQECTSVSKQGEIRVDQTRQRVLTFSHGCIEPQWDEREANVLAHQHGQAFNVVVGVIDELSGTSEEAIAKARQRFRPKR